MAEPPKFEPHASEKLKRKGWIVLGILVAAFLLLLVLIISSSGSEEKAKSPTAEIRPVPTEPEKAEPAQPQVSDPTAEDSASSSSEDSAPSFEVKGARTITVAITLEGPKPRIINALLGDRVRFLNQVNDVARVVTPASIPNYAFDTGEIRYQRSKTITLRGIGLAKYMVAPYIAENNDIYKTKIKRRYGQINIRSRSQNSQNTVGAK